MKPVTIGWIIFFGVPGTLWLLGAIVNRGQRSRAARVFAFMVGTDNRLSLSRLQAFLWSLVIFGSFASAMAIHKDIKPATTAEITLPPRRRRRRQIRPRPRRPSTSLPWRRRQQQKQ